MPVHPTIQAMLQAAQQAGIPGPSSGSPADARARIAGLRSTLGAGAVVGSCTEIVVPTRGGTMPALCLLPEAKPVGLVVYLHGGGWVVGALADFEILARRLCVASGCAVVLPEYRLAPEHPYPAAFEDAEDAVLWAWRERGVLAGHHGGLVVAGDSAGGNLAAVVAGTLRGRVTLNGQVLIYPVTDHDFETESYESYGSGYPLTRKDMMWFFDHYAPVAQRSFPTISPLLRKDLADLPPAVIALAEYDVLRSEGKAYGRHLKQAGIPVDVRLYPGMTHGFIRLHNRVDVAERAVGELGACMRAFCCQSAS